MDGQTELQWLRSTIEIPAVERNNHIIANCLQSAPVKELGQLKTRDWKTRHQLTGVENEGINCMDSQWDNFCNVLK